ncbi:MAG TPA: acylphosphatase [Chitinophagaceae bacterium]|nr:acylphosphatase [Chitinophagaceae bacterium]
MLQTISIVVKGKVQRVFFRHSARELAKKLKISGQVRNLPDGSVHIIATGTEKQLDKLTEWCRQGPSKAVVTGIESEKLPLQEFTDFTIIKF